MRPQGVWGCLGRRVAAAALLALVGLTACGRVGGSSPGAQIEAPSTLGDRAEITCAVVFVPPSTFRRTGVARFPTGRKIGTRMSYRGPDGARVHLTSGIEGEFGESLDVVEMLPAPEGGTGPLYGAPASGTWIFAWSQDDRCGTRTVTGLNMTRDAFMHVLIDAGVVPPPTT